MLHITNGDSTGTKLRQAALSGEIVAWNDVLHEGPVPAGLSLDALRPVRARFIADRGWGAYVDVLAAFARRDDALARCHDHDEIVLWFEHDLYDQLQLLQLLDWFAGRDLGATRLSLICVGAFPGVDPFHGLGQLTSAQLASLFPTRHAITPAELTLGRDAWAVFRSPDPTAILGLLAGDTSDLPFLAGALRRHLEEFPSVNDGLSRTERQLLEAVAAGVRTPVDIFLAHQTKEEHPFMGDTTLWSHLHGLSQGRQPLITLDGGGPFALPWECDDAAFRAQSVAVTARGRAVLMGETERVTYDGIDRWLGGVRLQGTDAPWRWDGQRASLVRGDRPNVGGAAD